MRIIVFSETTDRTAPPELPPPQEPPPPPPLKPPKPPPPPIIIGPPPPRCMRSMVRFFFSVYPQLLQRYTSSARPSEKRVASRITCYPIYTKVFFPQRGHAFGRYFKYAINAEKPIIPIIPTTNIHIKSSSDEEEERLPVMPARS